jgi:hypothetical protein
VIKSRCHILPHEKLPEMRCSQNWTHFKHASSQSLTGSAVCSDEAVLLAHAAADSAYSNKTCKESDGELHNKGPRSVSHGLYTNLADTVAVISLHQLIFQDFIALCSVGYMNMRAHVHLLACGVQLVGMFAVSFTQGSAFVQLKCG